MTLPLILARERDPELTRLDLREVTTPERAERVCDAIAATGALERRARGRSSSSPRPRPGCRPTCPSGSARRCELVADGVVERYS